MANAIVLFKVDVGFDPDRGYAAVLHEVRGGRMKGVKGNSIRNLMRNVSQQICDEETKMRRFPLEQERDEPSRIITPNGI